jgi:pyruvate/2-oxoglutarate dehydrogenase complex dihydrolipoamide dehydrogenase (E3) component
MVKLDLLVIGGGTAGGYAASTARRSLDAVGIAERGQVGGDCIFHACIGVRYACQAIA